jgi:hypothetical protein
LGSDSERFAFGDIPDVSGIFIPLTTGKTKHNNKERKERFVRAVVRWIKYIFYKEFDLIIGTEARSNQRAE